MLIFIEYVEKLLAYHMNTIRIYNEKIFTEVEQEMLWINYEDGESYLCPAVKTSLKCFICILGYVWSQGTMLHRYTSFQFGHSLGSPSAFIPC